MFDDHYASSIRSHLLTVAAQTSESPVRPGKGITLTQRIATEQGRRLRIQESGLMWPVACVRLSRLHHNARILDATCAAQHVLLAPHLKASMSPDIAALQTRSSGWALTVASPAQALVARSWGAPRLLFANETHDRALLSWAARQLADDPAFEFYFYVDSVKGAELAGSILGGVSSARVLVECGYPGGRAGARTFEQAVRVVEAARGAGLLVAGVAGYEGMIAEDRTPESLDRVAAFIDLLRLWARDLDAMSLLDQRCDQFVVSCGGSMFFDVIAERLGAPWSLSRPVVPLLRCGTYIFHDNGHYANASDTEPALGLRPAIEIWTQVMSCPEPTLVILNAGRRDIGSDLGLPVVLRHHGVDGGSRDATGAQVWELHDQHTLVRVPHDHAFLAGDLVVMGVSHPSITMDKWPALAVLDDDDLVVGQIATHY